MDFFPSQELNCPSFRWSATGIPVFDPGKKHRKKKISAQVSAENSNLDTDQGTALEHTKVEIEIRCNVDKYAYHTWILSMPQVEVTHFMGSNACQKMTITLMCLFGGWERYENKDKRWCRTVMNPMVESVKNHQLNKQKLRNRNGFWGTSPGT